MREHQNRRVVLGYALLLGLILLLGAWNLGTGSVDVPPGQILSILRARGAASGAVTSDTAARIVWDIRFPRLLAAGLLGGALSVSGFLLQTFFSNPIAGPFVLGISSGAKFTVALALILCLQKGMVLSSWSMVLAALVGSLLSMGAVLLLAGRVRSTSRLVVCGVMMGYLCSAATEFVVNFAEDANIVNLHNWSRGSFAGIQWPAVRIMAGIVLAGTAAAFWLSKPMGAWQLGEAYARNLGVDPRRLRIELVLLSSLLSACATAFAGPVSFVGVAVPHLVTTLFGTARPVVVVPACFLGGGAFCLLCDGVARTAFAPTELGIGTVTALLGAPVVVWMMAGRRGGR